MAWARSSFRSLDVAVIAQIHVGTPGGACAIGEHPLKVRERVSLINVHLKRPLCRKDVIVSRCNQ